MCLEPDQTLVAKPVRDPRVSPEQMGDVGVERLPAKRGIKGWRAPFHFRPKKGAVPIMEKGTVPFSFFSLTPGGGGR